MNPCDLIPDDAILWVTMGDDAPHPTTWEEFQGDNAHGEDGDALAFLEDVATALHARREYRGGGGAAPTYVVRWYPVPADEAPDRAETLKGSTMTTTDNTGTVMHHDDAIFREACTFAGVTPTKRQVSKYRNGYGALYNATRPLALGTYVKRCRAEEEARKAANAVG